MPSPSETVYPRLKNSITEEELFRCYTPNKDEKDLTERSARGASAKLGFLLLLKTCQTLGRFAALSEIPQPIVDHISILMGLSVSTEDLKSYDKSGSRKRHIRIIRKNRKLIPFDKKALKLAENAVKRASFVKNDVIDLINIAIEELIKNTCELPSFRTLVDLAQAEKNHANQVHIEKLFQRLSETQKLAIDEALKVNPESKFSDWHLVKQDPGNPSPDHLKELLIHLKTVNIIGLQDNLFEDLPLVKLEQFAADARSLNISRMNRMELQKKYALSACLFRTQKSRALDDIGEMIVRSMQKIHTRAKGSLEGYLKKHRKRTDLLVLKLESVALAFSDKSTQDKISVLKEALEPSPQHVLMECREHLAFSENNFLPFLWSHFKNQRSILFQALESLDIRSASQENSILSAISFICQNKLTGEDWLPAYSWSGNRVEYLVDLSWVPDQWLNFIAGRKVKNRVITNLDRKNFEVCVFTHVMWELKSGDLFIAGSQSFSDYRKQLISWDEYKKELPQYLTQVGLPTSPRALIEDLKASLTKVAKETDEAFPTCTAIRFVNGRPVLTKLNRKRQPQHLAVLEAMIESRMSPITILDALADVHRWLGLSKFFRPISGHDSRLNDLEERHIKTLFCYGCNLGPAQTVRSVKNSNRKELSWVHQRHFTEERIYEAITAIINEYNRFELPKFWGTGKTASADGTKWDLYEQNLLSEYHIRYGGYGGIGYYHMSDTYIALFSHFIPCGIRETTHILDGLLKNESDIQPDIIYGDSHAQNSTAFGLSYLLGISLMPRIKNWKKLTLYKTSRKDRYQNIEPLFPGEVIDWALIETHLLEMLRVAMSVKAGKLTSSTILKRLGSFSRKNKLYFAFREFGRAVRTIFLLKYISDQKMRSMIQGGINKSEGFNKFTQWVAFGSDGIIAENDRDQQRKIIAYNHLVSNCIIFHTINGMTNVIQELAQEGFPVDQELISCLSPFITKHINRFGNYTLDLKRKYPLAKYNLKLH